MPADPQYYKNLPRKYMSAGAIFLNKSGEILLVKPHYKDVWEIPGGMVDTNESPQQACVREVKEEINLNIKPDKLLVVDFSKQQEFRGDSLQFVFWGGVLAPDEIEKIKLQDGELTEFKFFTLEQAMPKISAKMKIRLAKSLQAHKTDKTLFYENEASLF